MIKEAARRRGKARATYPATPSSFPSVFLDQIFQALNCKPVRRNRAGATAFRRTSSHCISITEPVPSRVRMTGEIATSLHQLEPEGYTISCKQCRSTPASPYEVGRHGVNANMQVRAFTTVVQPVVEALESVFVESLARLSWFSNTQTPCT